MSSTDQDTEPFVPLVDIDPSSPNDPRPPSDPDGGDGDGDGDDGDGFSPEPRADVSYFVDPEFLPLLDPDSDPLDDAPVYSIESEPDPGGYASELRAQNIGVYSYADALRRGDRDFVEVGYAGGSISESVSGVDSADISGKLWEYTGHEVRRVGRRMEFECLGPGTTRATHEDTIMLSGDLNDTSDKATIILSVMSDDMFGGVGVRTTGGVDLWLHGLYGAEERPGTAAADVLVCDLAGTLYEREYGPSFHASALAVYNGTVVQCQAVGFRPLMKFAFGVRNIVSGGSGGGAEPGVAAPPPVGGAAAGATTATTAATATVLIGHGGAGTVQMAGDIENLEDAFAVVRFSEDALNTGEDASDLRHSMGAADIDQLADAMRSGELGEDLGEFGVSVRLGELTEGAEMVDAARGADLEDLTEGEELYYAADGGRGAGAGGDADPGYASVEAWWANRPGQTAQTRVDHLVADGRGVVYVSPDTYAGWQSGELYLNVFDPNTGRTLKPDEFTVLAASYDIADVNRLADEDLYNTFRDLWRATNDADGGSGTLDDTSLYSHFGTWDPETGEWISPVPAPDENPANVVDQPVMDNEGTPPPLPPDHPGLPPGRQVLDSEGAFNAPLPPRPDDFDFDGYYRNLNKNYRKHRGDSNWRAAMAYEQSLDAINAEVTAQYTALIGDAADLTPASDSVTSAEQMRAALADALTEAEEAGDVERAEDLRGALNSIDDVTWTQGAELAARGDEFSGLAVNAQRRALDPHIDPDKLKTFFQDRIDAAGEIVAFGPTGAEDDATRGRLLQEASWEMAYWQQCQAALEAGQSPLEASGAQIAYLREAGNVMEAEFLLGLHGALVGVLSDTSFHRTIVDVAGASFFPATLFSPTLSDLPLFAEDGSYIPVPGSSYHPFASFEAAIAYVDDVNLHGFSRSDLNLDDWGVQMQLSYDGYMTGVEDSTGSSSISRSGLVDPDNVQWDSALNLDSGGIDDAAVSEEVRSLVDDMPNDPRTWDEGVDESLIDGARTDTAGEGGAEGALHGTDTGAPPPPPPPRIDDFEIDGAVIDPSHADSPPWLSDGFSVESALHGGLLPDDFDATDLAGRWEELLSAADTDDGSPAIADMIDRMEEAINFGESPLDVFEETLVTLRAGDDALDYEDSIRLVEVLAAEYQQALIAEYGYRADPEWIETAMSCVDGRADEIDDADLALRDQALWDLFEDFDSDAATRALSSASSGGSEATGHTGSLVHAGSAGESGVSAVSGPSVDDFADTAEPSRALYDSGEDARSFTSFEGRSLERSGSVESLDEMEDSNWWWTGPMRNQGPDSADGAPPSTLDATDHGEHRSDWFTGAEELEKRAEWAEGRSPELSRTLSPDVAPVVSGDEGAELTARLDESADAGSSGEDSESTARTAAAKAEDENQLAVDDDLLRADGEDDAVLRERLNEAMERRKHYREHGGNVAEYMDYLTYRDPDAPEIPASDPSNPDYDPVVAADWQEYRARQRRAQVEAANFMWDSQTTRTLTDQVGLHDEWNGRLPTGVRSWERFDPDMPGLRFGDARVVTFETAPVTTEVFDYRLGIYRNKVLNEAVEAPSTLDVALQETRFVQVPDGWQASNTPGFGRLASTPGDFPWSQRESFLRALMMSGDVLDDAHVDLLSGVFNQATMSGRVQASTAQWRSMASLIGDLRTLADLMSSSEDAAGLARMASVGASYVAGLDWKALSSLLDLLDSSASVA